MAWLLSGVCLALLAEAAVLAWTWLPRWQPAWVIRNSPWVDPVLQAMAEVQRHVRIDRAAFDTGAFSEELNARFAATPADEMVAALLRAWRSDDPELRCMAAHILASDHCAKAQIPAFIAMVRDRDESICTAGIRALHQLDAPGRLDHFLPLLGHSDPDIRDRVVDCIGEIGDPRAIAALVRALAREEVPEDFDLAAFTGDGLHSATWVGTSNRLLTALAELIPTAEDDALDQLLRHPDRRLGILALRFGRPRRETLIRAMLPRLADAPQAVVLGFLDNPALGASDGGRDAIVALLRHRLGPVRAAATARLVEAPPARAMPLLVDHLRHDREAGVRWAAVRGLRGLPGDSPLAPAIDLAATATDEETRLLAVAVFWRRDEPTALPALLAACDAEEVAIAAAAARALTVQSAPQAWERLRRAVADPRDEVRVEAVLGVGHRRDALALPALVAQLGRPDPDQRTCCLINQAIIRLAPPAEWDGRIAAARAAALARHGPDVLATWDGAFDPPLAW